MNYSSSKKETDILIYGLCETNARTAARMYYKRYPQGKHLVLKTFINLDKNLRQEESFKVDNQFDILCSCHHLS